MNPVNGFTPEGLPTLLLSNMPVQSTVRGLNVTRPEVYFGELTFTPGAGVFPFHPDRYDYEWGRLFKTMSEADRSTDPNEFQQSSHA